MIETRIRIYYALAILTSLCSACGAFIAAVGLTSVAPYIVGNDGLVYLNLRPFLALAVSLAVVAATNMVFALAYYSLRTPYATRSLRRLAPRVLLVLCLDCALIALICELLRAPALPQQFYATYLGLALSGNFVLRLATQALIARIYTAGDNAVNVLIVGTNRQAHDFFRFLGNNAFLGFKVTGFVDDENHGGYPDVHLLGPFSEFDRIVRENVVDAVVIYLPVRSDYDKIISLIEKANLQGIPVQHMQSLYDRRRARVSASSIGDHQGMIVSVAPAGFWQIALKRLFDIVFSLAALTATAPVLLAAALAIKLDDGGPVFFTQARVGYHKRRFKLIKLRTMVVGAEKLMRQLETLNEMDGPVFKIKRDPRITRLGRILRKYNIDELPQFLNVLLGDMSVVGPRPMAQRDYQGFSEDWLRRRFSVRPGITGTWQTMSNRNAIPFETWMQMDMDYIANWSFLGDMLIILKTIGVTLGGTGQ